MLVSIVRRVTLDASADAAWRVIAEQFDQVDRWASDVHRATSRPGAAAHPAAADAPVAGRACATPLGPVEESIVLYDAQTRTLAYEAEAPDMPFFVRGLRNRWTVTEIDRGRTQVQTRVTVDLMAPFGWVMGPLMKRQIGKLLSTAVDDLKVYVETGRPHPRNGAAADSAQRAAA
ncbi:MAG: SRPBCC family protein [Acidobacteriota bacterium]